MTTDDNNIVDAEAEIAAETKSTGSNYYDATENSIDTSSNSGIDTTSNSDYSLPLTPEKTTLPRNTSFIDSIIETDPNNYSFLSLAETDDNKTDIFVSPAKTHEKQQINYSVKTTTTKKKKKRRISNGFDIGYKLRTNNELNNTSSIRATKEGLLRKSYKEWKDECDSTRVEKRVHRNLDQVIFPTGIWIRRWDKLMMFILLFFIIYLPYELGVSYCLFLKNNIVLGVAEFINIIFIIDIFLCFQRPYRGKDGKLVIDLRFIRWHYFTGMFLFDILSVIPFSLAIKPGSSGLKYVFLGCKIFRFIRFPRLFTQSQAMVDMRMQYKSHWGDLCKYSFIIIYMAHFFACVWCLIPYLENGESTDFTKSVNWIKIWYESLDDSILDEFVTNAVPRPYGDNHFSRYVIGFFWSTQTITSIGYGNISPVTMLEWGVGSIIQLMAGITWAYVLGGLIRIVTRLQMKEEEFGGQFDEANELIRAMNKEVKGYDWHAKDGPCEKIHIEKKLITKRIRSCIYDKYKLSSSLSSAVTRAGTHENTDGLSEHYPVLRSLPFNLREHASLLLIQKYLNHIPYLSSYFFTLNDQAHICSQCNILEYPAGDVINTSEEKGRGLWLLLKGCACYGKNKGNTNKHHRSVVSSGAIVGLGRVLLEDGHPFVGGRIFFLTYSRVLFIPRTAIFEALEIEPRAWKRCARWIYAKTLLSQSDVTQAY